MRGKNLIRNQDLGNSEKLWLEKIFYTIQGEGPYNGHPSIFIRLSGCNLKCDFCDTSFEDFNHHFSINEIINHLGNLGNTKTKLIVITGGEPFRQNISNLVDKLLALEYTVQIETNGTLFIPLSFRKKLVIVCSPKTANLNKELLPYINYYKYVLDANFIDPIDGLPNYNSQNMQIQANIARPNHDFDKGKIYVLPMDVLDENKNKLNLQACVKTCLDFGYKLSLQMHKYAGIE